MNPFSENFLNYDDIQVDFDKFADTDFSLTSPTSESTTVYAQTHSPPLQNDYYAINTQQAEVYQYDQGYSSPQDYSTGNGEITPLVDKSPSEDKLVSKSKRIQKRTEAKERTKVKQEAKAFFEGIDSKFLPEGYDDPNLDEKSRKKMIQMVRNRISAQNSRDRRKNRLEQLEEINSQLNKDIKTLTQEKNGLIQEINSLQNSNNMLFQENQNLKSGNLCSSCGRSQSGGESTTQNDEEAVIFNSDDGIVDGFSGLGSPTLSRFASSGKGFLGFFAFAAVVSCVVIMGVQNGGQMDFNGNRLGGGRILDQNGDLTDVRDINLNRLQFDYSKSLILKHMKPLKEHFDINHNLAFQAYLQKSILLDTLQGEVEYVNMEEPEYRNAIMDYTSFHQSSSKGFRRPSPVITAKNLPILSSPRDDPSRTSTLFCPSGLEFFDGQDNQSIHLGPDGKIYTNATSNLENAEYLQLLVPRSTLARYNVNNNLSGMYGIPFENEAENNSMLEVWCKVFMIRELKQAY